MQMIIAGAERIGITGITIAVVYSETIMSSVNR